MPALGQVPYFTPALQAGFSPWAYENDFVASLPVGGSVKLQGGLFVIKSSGQLVLPSAASQKYAGVLMAGNTVPYDDDTGGYYFRPGEMGQYKAKGFICCLSEVDLVPGDTVYVRHTANGTPGANEGVGRVRKTADTAKASTVNAQIVRAASAGQPVLLFLDLSPVPEANTGG
jgi:hypothetical protein